LLVNFKIIFSGEKTMSVNELKLNATITSISEVTKLQRTGDEAINLGLKVQM
jgi:hypothetical protein